MNRQYEIQTEIGNRFFRRYGVSVQKREVCIVRSKIAISTENLHVWRLGDESLSSYSTDFHDAFDVDSYARFPNVKPALFCALNIFCPGDRVLVSG